MWDSHSDAAVIIIIIKMAGQDKRTSLINIDETQEGGAQARRKRCAPGNDNEPYLIKSVPLSPTFRSTYPSFLLFLLRHIPPG